MAIAPTQKPDDNAGGGNVSGTDPRSAFSGTRNHDDDPTTMAGQYPPPDGWANAMFGGPMPQGTGAPGTQGATASGGFHGGGAADPTNEPGQTDDGFAGISEHDITESGAPGSATTPNTEGGSDTISYTQPGSVLSGTYQSETVHDDLSGGRDSTMANDAGYATGGPKLPGMMEPQAGGGARSFQPGSGGRVLRGGRSVRP
jgi:hypothetical protein